MKKFLMMVLAVALAATPALAGDVTMSGKYFLQGYSADIDGPTDGWYINDMEVLLTLKSGDVTAVIDLEPVDTNGSGAQSPLAGHTNISGGLIDNYWITAPLAAGLTLKTGEYALDFGKKIAIYNEGGYNIGLSYAVNDKVTVSGTIGKEVEGTNVDEDADTDVVVLSALMKELGPLTKLNFHIAYQMVEEKTLPAVAAESSDSLICIEAALPAGPVALAAEIGFASGDVATGNYFDIVAGLKELVGFDLNVELFMASDDLLFGDENWSPLLVMGNDDFGNDIAGVVLADFDVSWTNITFFALSGSYAVNDKLSVAGAAAMLMPTDDAAGDWDVTELDVTGTYKFADNFSILAGAGLVSGDVEATVLTTKAMFTF